MLDETLALGELGMRIDEFDPVLIGIIAEGFDVTDAAGLLKTATGVSAWRTDRETGQRQRLSALTRQRCLAEGFALHGLEPFMSPLLRHQERAAASKRACPGRWWS